MLKHLQSNVDSDTESFTDSGPWLSFFFIQVLIGEIVLIFITDGDYGRNFYIGLLYVVLFRKNPFSPYIKRVLVSDHEPPFM